MPFDAAEPPSSYLGTLSAIGLGIDTNWIQGKADGPNNSHCLVGWVWKCAPPHHTLPILMLLHDALPKKAQDKFMMGYEKWPGPAKHFAGRALAKYNDTHTQRSVRRIVQRAYNMLLSELEEHEKCQGF